LRRCIWNQYKHAVVVVVVIKIVMLVSLALRVQLGNVEVTHRSAVDNFFANNATAFFMRWPRGKTNRPK
jgi:hypothetical protein